MDGKPSVTAEVGVEIQLEEIASLTRQVIVFMDALSRPSIAALDAVGWHSGKTFALRAELARIAECADRASPARCGRQRDDRARPLPARFSIC
jgi:hypothetical protein